MKQSQFKFSNPYLEAFKFIENEEFKEEDFKGLKVDNEVIQKNISYDNNLGEHSALVELFITIGSVDSDSPFYIKSKMVSEFTYKGAFEDIDEFNKYLKVNAPALLLSYSRPIISLVTSQTKFPTLNIPFMNFVDDSDS